MLTCIRCGRVDTMDAKIDPKTELCKYCRDDYNPFSTSPSFPSEVDSSGPSTFDPSPVSEPEAPAPDLGPDFGGGGDFAGGGASGEF